MPPSSPACTSARADAALGGSATGEMARAGSPGGSSLEVRGLAHRFGSLRVLGGLSFSVRKAEIVGLLGPNGCGKSTTLRVLAGLLVPDAGEIVLDGEVVAPGGRRLRRSMGVVFQSGSLDPRLSARENLMLSAALYGVPRSTARERVAELLRASGLIERADDQTLGFSGGMRRRLELARALLHEPSLLVLDEPTTGLDESAYRQTWERVEALRRGRGLCVLLTTHRADEAERCDRVVVIDGGQVIAEGTPASLRQRVSGDVLTLEADEPERLAAEVAERFSVTAAVVDGKVVIERERGHELIPRLVEALPPGRIHSLSMHRPTLADVFVKLTGRSLGDDTPPKDGQP